MHIALALLQAFIALGAMAGGFLLIKDPSGAAIDLPIALLEGSVFPNFLVPGMFLFLVNGLGSMMGALLSFTKNRNAAAAAIALGAILVAWIVIQVSVIRLVHWLHALYIVLGLAELVLGLVLRRRRQEATTPAA